jgi:hypothetical protein
VDIRVLQLMHEKKPFHKIDGFHEAVMALVLGAVFWGSYGFPHFIEVALGCIVLGCISAFMWKKSLR